MILVFAAKLSTPSRCVGDVGYLCPNNALMRYRHIRRCNGERVELPGQRIRRNAPSPRKAVAAAAGAQAVGADRADGVGEIGTAELMPVLVKSSPL